MVVVGCFLRLPWDDRVNGFDRAKLGALRHRFGAAWLDVFGSVARGEGDPGGDEALVYELA